MERHQDFALFLAFQDIPVKPVRYIMSEESIRTPARKSFTT